MANPPPLKADENGFVSATDFEEWLVSWEVYAAELMGDAAADIAERHLNMYVDTLVASGDASVFDPMTAEWQVAVDEFLNLGVKPMYLQGSIGAQLGAPMMPIDLLAEWTEVVNVNAANYVATASNRIVGASQSIWSQVQFSAEQSISVGVEIPKLRQEVENITGYARGRAQAIARTETMGAYNGGDMEGARALGEYGPVEKSWLATPGSRTRTSHKRADGQTVLMDESFIVGGESMDRPLDPSADAKEVVNCRCVMQMFFVGDTRPDGTTIEAVTEEVLEAPVAREAITQETFDAPVTDTAAPQDFASMQDGKDWEFSDDFAVIEERISDLPEYATFRDTTPQRQYQEVINGRTEYNSYEVDQVMIDIARKSGADGLPTVLSSAEFEARAAIQSSRGFGNGRAAAQFVDGAYEPGIGLKGNGYYSTQNLDEGIDYATKLGGEGRGGKTLKMGLPDDARVISIKELDDQMDRLGDRVPDLFRDDPNRWALAQGYDAVRVPRAKGDWYIMLNRSRVLIDGGA